jgi:hypothetical protein
MIGLRLHLFEFNDQPWVPRILREAETAYLLAAYRMARLAPGWAGKIHAALKPGSELDILDLCSGAGGAIPAIIDELEKRGCKASVTLSDLYPHSHSATHSRMSWHTSPVDATRVPPELAGVRSVFSAFHHFRPDAARAILEDAFRRRRDICIFESGSGNAMGIISMLAVPLVTLAIMPFARPFRWAYLFVTYLPPILPLILLWDGIVSMLRIYSPAQMASLTKDLQSPDYVWEIGRLHVPGNLSAPYLIGRTVNR